VKRSLRDDLRRTVERLTGDLDGAQISGRLEELLLALAVEPDPPTSVAEPRRAVDVHVADSLVALQLSELRQARRIADMGAGAGFPGLVLAAALPSASVDLVEATARKCAVIERLIAAARLSNARVVSARVEALGAGAARERYDAVTARAVASLPVLVEYAAPLLRTGGALVAWKGKRSAEEERAGATAAEIVGLAAKDVLRVTPFEGARDRHLHVFVQRGPAPARFPRRPGRAASRPLA
jgi:16S rRNA (guanine527-N7)-methyltransferase